MDPVSALSLVTPVLRILSFSFTTAKKAWGAPDELQELSSELLQLDTLATILSSLVEAYGEGSSNFRALEPAITRLNNARKVFEKKLSQTSKTKSAGLRFRKRTWLRHHDKINKVIKDVAVVRKDLTAVMLLLNLTTVNALQNQQTNLLRLISTSHRQLGSRGALSAPEQLQTLDQAVVLAQSRTHTERTDELHEETELDDFLDAASQYSEEVSEALPFLTPQNRSVTDSFVASSKFFPESYIMEGPIYERLAIHSTKEFYRTAISRVDKYYLLFAKDSRHWSRVIVTATATMNLKLSEVSSHDSPLYNPTLPGMVQQQLESMLDAIDLYNTVTSISIWLQTDDEGDVTFDPKKSRIIEDAKEGSITTISQDIEEIKYRGLPQYLESEVIVVTRIYNHDYIVLVGSELCTEHHVRFVGEKESRQRSTASFLAEMSRLLMAQNCPGVAKFRGVVLSDDRSQIRSYLTRYHGEVCIVRKLMDPPIPWERKERWIRQAITLLAEVHKRGITLGIIQPDWIEVDSDDNIAVSAFVSKADYLLNAGGFLPPEWRKHPKPLSYAHGQELTFMSDIFQLGLFIWIVSQEVPIQCTRRILCTLGQCLVASRYQCTADHTNPIQLPACDSDVPTYINTIIGHCRQEQPSKRKPAAALLELLPPDEGLNDFSMSANIFSVDQVISPESRFQHTVCDECEKLVSEEHYHCNFCHQGSFDLCPECVSSGITCLDAEHRLSHRVLKDGRLVNEPMRNASTG